MTLRKPRSIRAHPHTCEIKGKHYAYGSVWCTVATTAWKIPRKVMSATRKSIEREIRRNNLTFVQWVPVSNGYDYIHRGYLWHVAADVVYDDAYDRLQRKKPVIHPSCFLES